MSNNKKNEPSGNVPKQFLTHFGSNQQAIMSNNLGTAGEFWPSIAVRNDDVHMAEEFMHTTAGFFPVFEETTAAASPWSGFGFASNVNAVAAGASPQARVTSTDYYSNQALPCSSPGFAAAHGVSSLFQPPTFAANYGQDHSQGSIGASPTNSQQHTYPQYQDQHYQQHQQRKQQQRATPKPPEAALEISDEKKWREQTLIQMEEAIRMLPMDLKAAYLEAREVALPVVEAETDPIKFFRVTMNHPWNAAKRLALYWKERKELFGPERAFLPLILTGQGALTREDTLTLRAGYPALLPESSRGRKVIIGDRNQHLPSASNLNRLRCLFYISRVVAEDPQVQTKEGALIILVMLTMPRWRRFDHSYSTKVFYLMEEVFPMRVDVHFLNKPPKHEVKSNDDRQRYRVQELITRVIGYLVESKANKKNHDDASEDVCKMPFQIHFERGQGELLDFLLTDLGLTRAGIPAFLGGEWTFVQAAEWCRQQAAKEKDLYKSGFGLAPSAGAAVVAAASSGSEVTNGGVMATTNRNPLDRVSNDESSQGGQGSSTVEEKDQRTKQRERNLIYSRRKRDRRRRELTDLKDEHDQLWGENDAMRDENARLQALLDKAKQYLIDANLM